MTVELDRGSYDVPRRTEIRLPEFVAQHDSAIAGLLVFPNKIPAENWSYSEYVEEI
jgi:hypothetical protein